MQQRIELQKSEQNDQDQQRIKEASTQKLANGRLSKENQQDYDLYMQQRLQFQQSNDPQRVIYDTMNEQQHMHNIQQQQQHQPPKQSSQPGYTIIVSPQNTPTIQLFNYYYNNNNLLHMKGKS